MPNKTFRNKSFIKSLKLNQREKKFDKQVKQNIPKKV